MKNQGRMTQNRICLNQNKVQFIIGDCVLADAEHFILDNQLLRRDLWRDFVSMFRLGLDSDNLGWRGEYFGKIAVVRHCP